MYRIMGGFLRGDILCSVNYSRLDRVGEGQGTIRKEVSDPSRSDVDWKRTNRTMGRDSGEFFLDLMNRFRKEV